MKLARLGRRFAWGHDNLPSTYLLARTRLGLQLVRVVRWRDSYPLPPMPTPLSPDMRAVIQAAHLCFAATVTPEGRPNLSPKGTIRVWDDTSLFFLDIASPGTRANLAANPYMELNVVDQLSRRGYRFAGAAHLHTHGELFDEACRRVFFDEAVRYPVAAVVLLHIERAAPLVSPGYAHIRDEAGMRAIWRERRAALDREFEAFLVGQDPDSGRLAT
jgi:hypothetical protein